MSWLFDRQTRLDRNRQWPYEPCYIFLYNECQMPETLNEIFGFVDQMREFGSKLPTTPWVYNHQFRPAKISGFCTKMRNDNNRPVLVRKRGGEVYGTVWRVHSEINYCALEWLESQENVWTKCDVHVLDEHERLTEVLKDCRTFLYDKFEWGMKEQDFDLGRYLDEEFDIIYAVERAADAARKRIQRNRALKQLGSNALSPFSKISQIVSWKG